MDKEIINLIDHQSKPSTLSWGLDQLLEEAIKDIKDKQMPNKGILLILDNRDGKFILSDWKKAGITGSDAIALIEMFKYEILKLLYNSEED